MKKIVLSIIIIICANNIFGQNFIGQWKGSFIDNSEVISWGSNRCDYVIDLDVQGADIVGYSYTYFNEGGKKYYTICKLKGIYDKAKKYIEITETARTKTNVPDNVTNSFQLHKLQWRREADKEILEGKWKPAPGQDRSINGYGTTKLTKRALTEIYPLSKKTNTNKSPFSLPKKRIDASITTKKISQIPKKSAQINTNKQTNKTLIKPIVKKPIQAITKKPTPILRKDSATKQLTNTAVILPKVKPLPVGFEKRNNTVLQTVEVENASVKIELYDNGEVDGDSVSLFYNGNVILAHKMLTTLPITINLPINNDEVNELVMYADNLGTLPPNTALMIVMDGNKRYEVRITSDLKKSGTIRFVHKKKQ